MLYSIAARRPTHALRILGATRSLDDVDTLASGY